MLETLKRRCAIFPDEYPETGEVTANMTQEAIVAEVYRVVNAKVSQSREETGHKRAALDGFADDMCTCSWT
jgi:hypothetical protein